MYLIEHNITIIYVLMYVSSDSTFNAEHNKC